MKTLICKFCQRSFIPNNYNYKKKYCSRDCFISDRKLHGLPSRRRGRYVQCEICGTSFWVVNSQSHRFCSKDCADKHQSRNKLDYVCFNCGKHFRISKSFKNRAGYSRKYCSLNCYLTNKDHKDQLVRMNQLQSYMKGPNKLEKAGQEILLSLGVRFGQQWLINEKINVDVYFPDYNLIVEWWGDYWHGHQSKLKDGVPDKRQKKRMALDASQRAYFDKCGIELLTFWEHEVMNEPNFVKKSIFNKLMSLSDVPNPKGIIKSMKPFNDIPHITIETITIYNCDCLDLLKRFPDHYFELAQVDPPYGMGGRWVSKGISGFTLKPDEIEEINKWDKPPEKIYFDELKRVSQNYLVWGGNYFAEYLGDSNSILIWDKQHRGFTLADGECCWTSYMNKPLRIINCGQSIRSADKKSAGGRSHPTQKPIYLYSKTLEMYAKPGYRILDTHLGSGTQAIACLMMGFELVACELNPEYYEKSIQKIRNWESSHQEMFDKKDVSSISLKEGDMF